MNKSGWLKQTFDYSNKSLSDVSDWSKGMCSIYPYKIMKEIVYLNMAVGIFPKTENGKWEINELIISKSPTKCKVINNDIIINDVYVNKSEDGKISLYNKYKICKVGFYTNIYENCWPVFYGEELVLEFKSDNYIIEAM